MQKLLMLYNVAQTYLGNTFQEVCDVNELCREEIILEWIVDRMITQYGNGEWLWK